MNMSVSSQRALYKICICQFHHRVPYTKYAYVSFITGCLIQNMNMSVSSQRALYKICICQCHHRVPYTKYEYVSFITGCLIQNMNMSVSSQRALYKMCICQLHHVGDLHKICIRQLHHRVPYTKYAYVSYTTGYLIQNMNMSVSSQGALYKI